MPFLSKKKIFLDTIVYSFAFVIAQIVSFIVLPVFISGLGSELYGIWVIANLLLGYLAVFDFGFTTGLQKYIVESRLNKDFKLMSKIIVTGAIALFSIGGILGLTIYSYTDELIAFFQISNENKQIAYDIIRITAIFTPLLWSLKIIDVLLKTEVKIRELGILHSLVQMIPSIVLLILISNKYNIIEIKWIHSITLLLSYFPGIYFIKKANLNIELKIKHFSMRQLKNMFRFNAGMFYMSVISLLAVRLDSVIIAKFISVQAVTIYAVIGKTYQLVQMIGNMVMTSLLPISFNILPKANPIERSQLISSAVKYRTIVMSFSSTILILIMPSFIRNWMGPEFEQYVYWGQVYLICHFFSGLMSLSRVGRIAGVMKFVNIAASLKVLINFGFSIFFVHAYGWYGVILGTLSSNLLFGELIWGGYVCRKLNIPYRHVLKSFFIPNIICIIFLFLGIILNIPDLCLDWIGLVTMSIFIGLVLIIFLGFSCLRKEIEDLKNHYSKRKFVK